MDTTWEQATWLFIVLGLFAAVMMVVIFGKVIMGKQVPKSWVYLLISSAVGLGFSVLIMNARVPEPDYAVAATQPSSQQFRVPSQWAATPMPKKQRRAPAPRSLRRDSFGELLGDLQQLHSAGALVGEYYVEDNSGDQGSGDRFVMAGGASGFLRAAGPCVIEYCEQGPCNHPLSVQRINFKTRVHRFETVYNNVGTGQGRSGGTDLYSRYGYRFSIPLQDEPPNDLEVRSLAIPVLNRDTGDRVASILNRMRDACRAITTPAAKPETVPMPRECIEARKVCVERDASRSEYMECQVLLDNPRCNLTPRERKQVEDTFKAFDRGPDYRY